MKLSGATVFMFPLLFSIQTPLAIFAVQRKILIIQTLCDPVPLGNVTANEFSHDLIILIWIIRKLNTHPWIMSELILDANPYSITHSLTILALL